MVMDGASSCKVAQGFSGAVGSTLGRFRTTRPDRFSPHALYRFLEAMTDEFSTKNVGAAIPHANKDYILTQPVPLPPRAIALRFHDQLEVIQITVEILREKLRNLRRTRDLLLPKLLAGEIDVSRTPERETVAV
jgi:restriction endonuclease S subunit